MAYSYIQESKALIKLATPIALTTLIQEAMGFIDMIMLGRYDATQFAASGLGTSIWLFGLLAITGSMMGTSALIAKEMGANNKTKVRNLYRQSLWLALVLGFFMFLLLPALTEFLPLSGIQPELVPHTLDYINITAYSMPALAFYMSMRFFSEGIEWPLPMMLIALLMLPFNIIGNYFLIFGNGGFPELGLKGAAISTTIGINLSALLLWGVIRYAKPYQAFQAPGLYSWPSWKVIGRILILSLPIAGSLMLEHGFFMATYVLAGKISTLAAAAHNIAINYASMMFVIPLGIAGATTVKVSNALGRGSTSYAKFRGWTGISVAGIFMLCSAGVLLVLNQQIANIYTSDTDIITPAASLLMIAAMFQLSDGIQVSASGALRGFQDTALPMMINLLAYWVIGLPLAAYLAFSQQLGASGLWFGLIGGLTVAASLLVLRFYRLEQASLTPRKNN